MHQGTDNSMYMDTLSARIGKLNWNRWKPAQTPQESGKVQEDPDTHRGSQALARLYGALMFLGAMFGSCLRRSGRLRQIFSAWPNPIALGGYAQDPQCFARIFMNSYFSQSTEVSPAAALYSIGSSGCQDQSSPSRYQTSLCNSGGSMNPADDLIYSAGMQVGQHAPACCPQDTCPLSTASSMQAFLT